jgi:hypothetical protein
MTDMTDLSLFTLEDLIEARRWIEDTHRHRHGGSGGKVQDVSDGRFVLGIGRGDSGQAHLGMASAPLAFFERYVTKLQAYLRGERVEHDLQLGGVGGQIPPAVRLGMVDYPETSTLA